MPKRFSEADAKRIFAAAAERQLERGQDEPGLTLEELEEIGRTSGLDPELVREAAEDALRPSPTGTTKTVLGMPVAFRRERFVRGTVTPEAWAQIVVDLRQRFNKTGLVTDIGPLREWRSVANDQQQPVTVTLTPERDGTRVIIEQSQVNSALGLGIGTGVNALMGLLFLIFANVETGEPGLMVPAAILLSCALLFGMGAFFGMRTYGRKQTEKFDAVMDRIDLAIRDSEATAPLAEAAPITPEAQTATPRLDLGALPDAEASGEPRTRTRERS